MLPRYGPLGATKCKGQPHKRLGATHTEPAPTKCENPRLPTRFVPFRRRHARQNRGAESTAEIRAALSELWNLMDGARIRAFLEDGVCELAWFFRHFVNGGVTMNVICRTPNRVSRTCSKNPNVARDNSTMLD
jgi:hypothetical protein